MSVIQRDTLIVEMRNTEEADLVNSIALYFAVLYSTSALLHCTFSYLTLLHALNSNQLDSTRLHDSIQLYYMTIHYTPVHNASIHYTILD